MLHPSYAAPVKAVAASAPAVDIRGMFGLTDRYIVARAFVQQLPYSQESLGMGRDTDVASRLPGRMLIGCLIIIALSTGFLPFVRGYGTQLFQMIVLPAWLISAKYANGNFLVHLLASVSINIVLFSIIALPLYFVFRRLAPRFSSVSLLGWLLFYVGCLFFFFRATDGP